MENSNPISVELNSISPLVANIGNHSPYTAPAGYFDAFAVQLMLRIAMEEKAGVDPVLNIKKDAPYQVPAGYFDGLAATILNRVKAQETTNTSANGPETVSPLLAGAEKNNVYSVPEEYFDGLAGKILNRIKAQETNSAKEELELLSPLLGQLGKKNPFTSPEGYFNDFSENIVAGVKAIDFVNEELENLSPLMAGLKSRQVYEVPDGYFDTSATAILDKIKKQPAAKVVSIGFGKKIMRYAAAAVVAGIVVAAGYIISSKPAAIENTLANKVNNWDSANVAKIPDQEIESFLNTNTISLADVSDDNSVNENDLKDLLADISDEELQQYLEQHGSNPNSITN